MGVDVCVGMRGRVRGNQCARVCTPSSTLTSFHGRGNLLERGAEEEAREATRGLNPRTLPWVSSPEAEALALVVGQLLGCAVPGSEALDLVQRLCYHL